MVVRATSSGDRTPIIDHVKKAAWIHEWHGMNIITLSSFIAMSNASSMLGCVLLNMISSLVNFFCNLTPKDLQHKVMPRSQFFRLIYLAEAALY